MVFFYEQKAMNGEPMPDDLDWLDQKMYVLLRHLYADVKRGVIVQETGKAEKKKLVSSYNSERNLEAFDRKWVNHTVQLWKGIEIANSRYRKNKTIENADLLSDALLGFVSPNYSEDWLKEDGNYD